MVLVFFFIYLSDFYFLSLFLRKNMKLGDRKDLVGVGEGESALGVKAF